MDDSCLSMWFGAGFHHSVGKHQCACFAAELEGEYTHQQDTFAPNQNGFDVLARFCDLSDAATG